MLVEEDRSNHESLKELLHIFSNVALMISLPITIKTIEHLVMVSKEPITAQIVKRFA